MRGRRSGAVVVLAVAVAVLGGCTGDRSGPSSEAYPAAAAPDRAGEVAGDVATGSAGSAGAAGEAEQAQPVPVALADRQVVRTATLDVTVDDADAAVREARLVGPQVGGYLETESSTDSYATLTLRVAADRLDDALTALGDLGSVTTRQVSTDDVTEESVDVAARIQSQQASVERVRALLAQAVTVGEVVQVEGELVTREAELESLQQRSAALAGSVALSTVQVSLSEPSEAVGTEPEDLGFLAGLGAGWEAFVGAVVVLLTAFGALLPFLLVLGVPLVAALVWWRRRRAGRRAPAPPAAA